MASRARAPLRVEPVDLYRQLAAADVALKDEARPVVGQQARQRGLPLRQRAGVAQIDLEQAVRAERRRDPRIGGARRAQQAVEVVEGLAQLGHHGVVVQAGVSLKWFGAVIGTHYWLKTALVL